MFSNITEAWSHDPVKEMTNKLSGGAFQTNTNQSEIFNFKNQSNNVNQKRVNMINSKDNLSLSDASGLSLLSENTIASNTINSDFKSFAPVNFDKYKGNKMSNKKYNSKNIKFNISDGSDSEIFSEPLQESRCNYSIRHLKKCDKCYDKLKKLVNTKVNNKFDEIILENKMKQLQNITSMQPNIIQPQQQSQVPISHSQNNTRNDSWKETLIIVVGAIIAIFIIFLIVRALHK
jgi:hypothetical protein